MKRIRLALSVALLLSPLSAVAAQPLFLRTPALIDPAATIPDAVRNQCDIDKVLADDVLAALNERYGPTQAVTTAAQAGDGLLLQLTITEVYGLGGGGWSGGKYMSARADLLQGDKKIDYVYLKRSSSGGILGGVTGTCGILDRIGRALGKDTANWLERRDKKAGTASTSE